MSLSKRLFAGALALGLIASACATPASAPATPSAAPTASATPTRQVVLATAQGATSARFDSKLAIIDGVAPDLAPGNYMSTVQVVTIEKGGRTVAHKHGGVEMIYVLQGTIDFRTAGGASLSLVRGQGAVVQPGTVVQMVNGGETIAKFLAFMMTAETAPFQTNVDEAP
jgi:quercetin dioxygenase-like cupin family protein